MNTLKRMYTAVLQNWPLLLAGIILSVLLFRNPYSIRTLIPNFEPFPDTFHYVVPSRCFLHGKGWKLCRESFEGVKPAVPPLYGVVLIPAFIFSSDPRSFYFINVLLAFVSLGLLYLLIKRISKNKFLQLLIVTIFVTTYQVYWVPTLAMAENLLLPLLFGAFYLISSKKLDLVHIVGTSTLAGLLYGSKFAALPIATGICLILGIRLLLEHFISKQTLETTITRLTYALVPVLVLFMLFGGWQTVSSIFNFNTLFTTTNEVTTQSTSSPNWFSEEYFVKNISIYLQAARGESTRFLWDYTPLVSTWMTILAWFGLGYSISLRRWRWLSTTVLATIIFQFTILATFYSADTRYIYNLLPAVLIGIAFFFVAIKDILSSFSLREKKISLLITLACFFILTIYSFVNFNRLKSQASINIRYAETPWWYLAIEEMNTYFNQFNAVNTTDKETIVITPMVPYLIDFYQTADFSVLPLDDDQDFRSTKVEVWGENNYSDLLKLYQSKIEAGHPVFVAKYGIGNEKPKQDAFSDIEKTFIIEEVHNGCFDQCDIYKLKIKPELEQ